MPDEKTEIQWMCFYCLACGDADNQDQALAFITFHEKYACPATAPSYDDPVDGFVARMARRENMRRVYGDGYFPKYTRPYGRS